MIANRAEQIKASLSGLGTHPKQDYTLEEIIARLIELENALLAGVYEKNHAENMRPQDLTKHVSALAEEFGLAESDAYKRFMTNMRVLDYTVKTLIAGKRGEKLARYSLRPLTYDQSTKILYNVQLSNESFSTEYDAIVVAPHGLFVIEVKNWLGEVTLTKDGILVRKSDSVSSNLAARMGVKEALLKECLGDMFPANYYNVLLLPEEKTKFKDEYYRIPSSYGANIVSCIKFCNNGRRTMTAEQIDAIVNRINGNAQVLQRRCTVKCKEIIEDYALLMAQIEAASGEAKEDIENDATNPPPVTHNMEDYKDTIRKVDWRRIGGTAAGIAVAIVSGFVAGRFVQTKSR